MSFSRIALSSLAVTGLACGASAAYVNATFTGVTPGVTVNVQDTNNSISLNNIGAGGFNFTRTGGTATDPYLGATYVTFCIDISKTVAVNGNYGWSQTPLPNAPTPPGGPNSNFPMGAVKAALIGKLWGAHRSGLSTNVQFGAFQLAVWEIIFENSGTLDVLNGNFTVSGGDANSALARNLANTWLGNVGSYADYGGVYALTGNTADGNPQDQLVPSPGSLALCGLGGLIVARRRR